MKLTDWEVGNDLLAISDYIGEKLTDIKASGNREELVKVLEGIRAKVGDEFEALEAHSFGTYNSKDFYKKYPEEVKNATSI